MRPVPPWFWHGRHEKCQPACRLSPTKEGPRQDLADSGELLAQGCALRHGQTVPVPVVCGLQAHGSGVPYAGDVLGLREAPWQVFSLRRQEMRQYGHRQLPEGRGCPAAYFSAGRASGCRERPSQEVRFGLACCRKVPQTGFETVFAAHGMP